MLLETSVRKIGSKQRVKLSRALWNLCARRAHASFEFSRSGLIFQTAHAEPDAANHPPGAQERSPEAEPGMEPETEPGAEHRNRTINKTQEQKPGAETKRVTINKTQERIPAAELNGDEGAVRASTKEEAGWSWRHLEERVLRSVSGPLPRFRC